MSVFAVLAIIVAGLLLEPLQIPLLRVLEGYWRWDWLREWRCSSHEKRRKALDEEGQTDNKRDQEQKDISRATNSRARAMRQALGRYPPYTDKVLPTALGNALLSAERRAGERYGFDTVTIWPRFYPVLSDRVTAILDDRRMQLDIASRFTVTFLMGSLVSAGLLIAQGPWLLVPVAAGVLAAFAYRSAIEAAILYGEGMKVAFDLRRFDLLDALHVPLPPDLERKRAVNMRLTRWFRTGFGTPAPYMHAAPDAYFLPGPPSGADEHAHPPSPPPSPTPTATIDVIP